MAAAVESDPNVAVMDDHVFVLAADDTTRDFQIRIDHPRQLRQLAWLLCEAADELEGRR
jgi:hypothetical protein